MYIAQRFFARAAGRRFRYAAKLLKRLILREWVMERTARRSLEARGRGLFIGQTEEIRARPSAGGGKDW